MENFLEKMKSGRIGIMDNELVGLGYNDETLNLERLDALIESDGKDGIIESLADAITAIGMIYQEMSVFDDSENPEVRNLIDSKIKPILRCVDVYSLNELMKVFVG